jgi:glycolate oxidase FAD binding subunit
MNESLAVAGVVPAEIVMPRDLDELAAIVGERYARGSTFAFVGGGTQLDLGNRPAALDTIVRTTALDRVIDYTPEDQTITVESGMTLAALDRVLAEQGQMLPLDGGDRERATVGGAIAANLAGRHRLRYGTVKDMIVGVAIVRPDGTPSRGGGKVVKNVAGFDLPKLMVGSLGTLGAIATATLRVCPAPEATAFVTGAYDEDDGFVARDVAALSAALVRERLEPVAMWASSRPDGRYRTTVEFAGSRVAVEAQCRACEQLIAECGVSARICESDTDEGEHETRARYAAAPRIRIGFPPASLAQLDDLIRPLIDGDTSVNVYPGVGIAVIRPAESVDHGALLAVVRKREDMTAVVEAMPPQWAADVDAWGNPPRALRLMRALKTSFDPRGLCNPGRYVGGL